MMMNAKAILDLLAARHSKDVFVSECKDGPSQYVGHRRLDAWAMRRSWTSPTTYGYEIKVSRSDFVNDTKWTDYLGLCSAFSFVCPFGMIQPEELPQHVGLLWIAKTGSRLFTKRKSPIRDVEIPESLFRYILMARCSILGPHEYDGQEKPAEYWARWLQEKRGNRELGWKVSKAIRDEVAAKITETERENDRLISKMRDYDSIRDVLSELGVKPDGHVSKWTVQDRIENLSHAVHPSTRKALSRARDELGAVLRRIDETEAARGEAETL